MPADCNVHYTSPDRGIDTLIIRFSSDLAKDPLHTYLIAPTKQLVRSIQKRLDQEAVAYVPDHITTIKEFCKDHIRHSITDLYVIDGEEAMAILDMLFDTHKSSFPLLRAYHRSSHIRELFRFFGEITKHAIPFPECFHDHHSEKIKELGDLYELYHSYLREHHYVDEYLLIERTRKNIVANRKQLGIFYFFGLYDLDLSLLERDLILALCDHAKKVDCTVPYSLDPEIFKTQPPYLSGSSDSGPEPDIGDSSAFTNIFAYTQTKILHQIPIYSTIYLKEENETKKKKYIEHCSTKTEEITLIAKEITKLCAEEYLYDDIIVAFPDVKDILLFLDMVFEEYQIPFYTSQKYRFSSHPFSMFCMDIFSLIEQDLSYEKLYPVIMSPYFKYRRLFGKNLDILMRWARLERIPEDIEGLREKIENMEEEKGLSLPKNILLEALAEYQNLEREIRALWGKKTAKEHAEDIITFFERIINEKHTYGENNHIRRIYSRFQTYLRDTTIFIHTFDADITLEQYCKYTRNYLEQAPFPGPPDRSGVKILSLRELAYESCSYLFLAGLNEGAIPRLTDRHPLTTKKEAKLLNILKPADLIKIEQYFFISALCAGKKAIYLSACNDESKNLIESSFFDQVLFNCHVKEWELVDENRADSKSDNSDLALRIEVEEKYRIGTLRSKYDGIISDSPCIREYLLTRFGPDAYWSVSRLETYAHCPFRFWIEKILYVKPLEDPSQEINPTEHGTLVHQILHDLYKELQKKGHLSLTKAHEEEIMRTLDDIKKKYLSEQESWLPEAKAKIGGLIKTQYTGEGSLKRFILSEITNLEEIHHHIPTSFEYKFGPQGNGEKSDAPAIDLNLCEGEAGSRDDEQDQMLLSGAIDRIDHIGEGEPYFGIIDYKTGAVSTIGDIKSGLSLQLPLYMHAYNFLSGKSGIYGSYIQFKGNDVKTTTPLYDEEARAHIPYLSDHPRKLPDSLDEIIQNAVIQARGHIRDIRKGCFPVTARSECPDNWCKYRSICRYNINRGSESREHTLYCDAESE